MMRPLYRRDVILGMLAASLPKLADAAETGLDFVTYHDQPPLVTEAGAGLSYDLARYFQTAFGNAIRFETILMPRLRLDDRLEDPLARLRTLIPWVSPDWFSPAQMEVLAPSLPLLDDPDIILSRRSDAILYSGPEALTGRRFGAVRGHRYPGIDTLVEAGKIERQDFRSLSLAVESLRLGRIDATLLPQSSYLYLISARLRRVFYLSAIPGEDTGRVILVPRERPGLLKRINEIVAGMGDDPAWRAILGAYRLG